MNPNLRRLWLASGIGFLLLLESGCALPLERKGECMPSEPDVQMVTQPITLTCKEKVARLTCQLAKCQKQWSWRSIYYPPYDPEIADIDRVVADLKSAGSNPVRTPVSWRRVEATCESAKQFCFLGLEVGTEFVAMQCQL